MTVGQTVFAVSGQRPEVVTGVVAEVDRSGGVRLGNDWWTASRVYTDRAAADAEHADERAEWLAFCEREERADRKLLARHGLTA
jgi:hypothetical protein